jgi:uncharacterized protein with FMN-binding domain
VVSGQGVTNTVTVTVTLTNSVITNATATYTVPSGDSTSKRIIVGAIPTLNAEAIAANSATIANVSGATYITNGYKQSLTAALTASGR